MNVFSIVNFSAIVETVNLTVFHDSFSFFFQYSSFSCFFYFIILLTFNVLNDDVKWYWPSVPNKMLNLNL